MFIRMNFFIKKCFRMNFFIIQVKAYITLDITHRPLRVNVLHIKYVIKYSEILENQFLPSNYLPFQLGKPKQTNNLHLTYQFAICSIDINRTIKILSNSIRNGKNELLYSRQTTKMQSDAVGKLYLLDKIIGKSFNKNICKLFPNWMRCFGIFSAVFVNFEMTQARKCIIIIFV